MNGAETHNEEEIAGFLLDKILDCTNRSRIPGSHADRGVSASG
jgi:hypothetical protein